MLFLITLLIFTTWAIYVIRKGHISWHAALSIYFIVLFVVDNGDDPGDLWFNFYDLPVHLLDSIDKGHYLGIIFSDGFIFPAIAIVFCYYAVKYRRPWLISLIFAVAMGLIEYSFVKFGFMIYHGWHHWTTAAITFIAFRVLAIFAERLLYYSPPVPYRVCLLGATYSIIEWPGAIFEGMLRLNQFRPHIFRNETADDRFVGVMAAIAVSVIIAILIPKLQKEHRIYLFLGIGIVSAFFGLWAHSTGVLIYNHWSNAVTIARYILPYFVLYFYDRWETNYRLTLTKLKR